MAVYTHLSTEQIAEITRAYGRGELQLSLGIAEGVENSNYLIESQKDGSLLRSILTLFEKRVAPKEIPFFLALKEHLAARAIPCPVPLALEDGSWLLQVEERQAAMITFLSGQSKTRLTAEHCRQLGAMAAHMHDAAADFSQRRANDLSVTGWQQLFTQLDGRFDEIAPGLQVLVSEQLEEIGRKWPEDLPAGIIHADLFPNNVFFEGDRLSGVIDFYFACHDLLAYELAICLNCWCFDTPKEFNVTRARALLAGYESVRPLTAAEREGLPLLARGAALRFLLTRAYDWLHTPKGALVTPHDPMEYAHKLRFHMAVQSAAEYGL